jgi:hypothetical protein
MSAQDSSTHAVTTTTTITSSHYSSWFPQGIDLQRVLNFMNYTEHHPAAQHTVARKSQPFYVLLLSGGEFAIPQRFSHATVALQRWKGMVSYFQQALHDYNATHFPALQDALSTLSSLPLVMDLGDYRGCPANPHDEAYRVPLWTLCQAKTCPYGFPIPTYQTYHYAVTRRPRQRSAWSSKIPQVYWRGGCKQTQRREMVRKANEFFNFTRILNVRPTDVCGRVARMAPKDSFQHNYKMVLDMDGNSWSERLPRLLCEDAAVMIVSVEEDYEEYWVRDLVPGVHYIAANLDNFTQVAFQMISNDAQLQRLVANANAYCDAHLTVPRFNYDFVAMLNHYIEAWQQGTPDWYTQWQRVAPLYQNQDFLE